MAEPAGESLAAALQISERLGARGAGLADAARAAFVDGLSGAMVAAAILMAVGAAVVFLRSPRRLPRSSGDLSTRTADPVLPWWTR